MYSGSSLRPYAHFPARSRSLWGRPQQAGVHLARSRVSALPETRYPSLRWLPGAAVSGRACQQTGTARLPYDSLCAQRILDRKGG